MLWHEGDISDAVNKVNVSNKYLVVFLRDDSSPSQIYSDIFESSKELHLSLNNCVCLNLLKGGTEYQQFSDVYKATEVPSVYVITYLGQVVDIIKDEINEEELICKLKKNVLTDAKDVESMNNVSSSLGSGEIEKIDMDEKIIEMRQKLAEKHRLQKEEEKAKEVAEEINRRELGKKLDELKKSQKEQEENEIKDEIKRKRQEDKDARDKVLRQIEEDKLERKNKFANQSPASAVHVDAPKCDFEVRNRLEGNYLSSRIQFRFPDGSSKNSTFDCDTKFDVVRQLVTAHVKEHMNSRKFEIRQFFPTKTMSREDDLLSLKELQLVPSASLAVIFADKVAAPSQVTAYSEFLLTPFNFLYLSVCAIFQWIKRRLSGAPERTEAPGPSGVNVASWEERQRRLMATESRTIKKDGNMAQFSDAAKKKDDEDDATWNGNSTQQM